MPGRIEHTAGAAVGWLIILGVVAGLAPEAARQARELASEVTGTVRTLRSRLHRPPEGPADLADQVRELAPHAATW